MPFRDSSRPFGGRVSERRVNEMTLNISFVHRSIEILALCLGYEFTRAKHCHDKLLVLQGITDSLTFIGQQNRGRLLLRHTQQILAARTFSDTEAEIGEAVDFVIHIERQPVRRVVSSRKAATFRSF